MAGKRQPTDLLLAKGKKHLTREEIRERKASELIAAHDDIAPPRWLTAKQEKRFKVLAAELIKLEILANVDCEALARLVVAEQQYVEITEQIAKLPIMVKLKTKKEREQAAEEKEISEEDATWIVNQERNDLLIQQDRCWKQCRQGAADFGLSIAQRCRIVAPKAKETAAENKFARFAKKVEAVEE